MRCVICAIAKQENLYIFEWAKHHLEIGFAHLHIYDNNELDGESISDVFKGSDIEEKITIHDVRGLVSMQLDVYQQCYDNEDFDWCAFIDIDEFISFVSPSLDINYFLKDKYMYDAVHLNWLCYGDNELINYDDRNVKERFVHHILPIDFKSQYILIPENAHIKSIIRKGLRINWNAPGELLSYATPHTPANLNYVCNDLGKIVKNMPWNPMSHNVCYVAHYITKTIEEYGDKTRRRAADSNGISHSYARFFRYNKLTLQKLILLKKVGVETRIVSIILEKIKWWNFLHQTYFSFLYKKYRRILKRDREIIASMKS